MNLQDLIKDSDLNMTVPSVKAFFLGTLFAQKPLAFPKALEELLAENQDERTKLESELKKLWDELTKNKHKSLADLLDKDLQEAVDQVDYFILGMNAAGTFIDDLENDEEVEIFEELEELVMEVEETFAEKGPTVPMKETEEHLRSVWKDFVALKQ